MVSWQQFADANPALAQAGQERLDSRGVLLVGTICKDGTPRISPVEPVFFEGQLYLGMMWKSKKALDLLRDPRILVHSIVEDKDATGGDFKVRGRAVEVTDGAERDRYGDALFAKIGWKPDTDYHLFRVDIEDVSHVGFTDGKMAIERWRPGQPAPV